MKAAIITCEPVSPPVVVVEEKRSWGCIANSITNSVAISETAVAIFDRFL
jgi:hypothetical protein